MIKKTLVLRATYFKLSDVTPPEKSVLLSKNSIK
jgi:hypothetical protein